MRSVKDRPCTDKNMFSASVGTELFQFDFLPNLENGRFLQPIELT